MNYMQNPKLWLLITKHGTTISLFGRKLVKTTAVDKLIFGSFPSTGHVAVNVSYFDRGLNILSIEHRHNQMN